MPYKFESSMRDTDEYGGLREKVWNSFNKLYKFPKYGLEFLVRLRIDDYILADVTPIVNGGGKA